MKILVSAGFGAGWSSWNYGTREEKLFMLTYEPFIECLESGDVLTDELVFKFRDDFLAKFPTSLDTPYEGSLRDLYVVEVDGPFVITEYDGAEGVMLRDEVNWFNAEEER